MTETLIAEYHLLWQHAVNQLEHYRQALLEGREVDEAFAFSSFVIRSRLVQVLREYDNSGVLKVDSAFLDWKAREIQQACQDIYRANGNVDPSRTTYLEAIHHKLDLIAAHVAKLEPRSAMPSLQVVQSQGKGNA